MGIDAIELIESQHREVEELFEDLEDAESEEKEAIFSDLADLLAIHATIEERHFYPAVRARRTEDEVNEAMEEHLSIKRVLVDLLGTDTEDSTFDAKVKVLKEQVQHHVQEEEEELLPDARELLSKDELVAIAQEMAATQSELEGKEPRTHIPAEVAAADVV